MPQQLPTGQPTDINGAVRTMQIIAGALLFGTFLFGAIAVFIAWPKQPPAGLPAIALLGVGFAVLAVAARVFVPRLMASAQRTQLAEEARSGRVSTSEEMAGRLYGVYQTKMIVGMALLEGAAFFNLVAYMVAAPWWSLATAGLLWLLMVVQFPTRNRLEYWVHDQLQLMEIDRT